MANPPRWKDKRDKFIRSDFVGRQDQLIAFRTSVTDPAAQKMIFAISGQGGVGKTTLLKEFRRITEECKHIAAYVDEGSATNRVDDVPEALYRLAKDFENQNPNYKFEKFQDRYKVYRQKRQELEADPEAPSGIASGVGRLGTRLAVEGMNLIPGMSLMSGLVDTDKVVEKGGDLLSFALKKFNNKDEVQLVTEPLEVLTPLFLEEINRIAEKQLVVLLLDTYEVTGKFLDEWLRGVLGDRYGEDLTGNFRLGIAGREPLDRNAWVELEPCIARSPLEPFTEEEVKQFLARKEITSEAVIAQIWQLSSGGLPLLVSMMAQNAPTRADAVVDLCKDAVERFLKWEKEPIKRQLAQDGAIPRVLNEDVVNVLGDGQFEWLQDCAFMIRDGSQWRYHLVVREQMVRYQRQRSLKRWAKLHGKLAAYYEELGQGLGLEAGQEAKDERWRELALEWLYHELCAAPQAKLNMALNGFLTALDESDTFARSWAVIMVQAGQEANCKELQRWGERLRDGIVAYQEGRYEEAIPAITALLKENIERQLQPVALIWIGNALFNLGRNEEAITSFNKAIEIKPDDHQAWMNWGLALGNLERYEEAIAYFDKALEIKPDFHEAWHSRGVALFSLRRNEDAIASFDKSLDIKPDFYEAWFIKGITLFSLGRNEDAIDFLQQYLTIAREIGDRRGEGAALGNLGIAYYSLGRYEEAIDFYQQRLTIAREIGDRQGEGNALGNLGVAYNSLGRYEEAIDFHQQYLTIAREIGDRLGEGTALGNLGIAYHSLGRYEEAIDFHQQYLTIAREIGNRLGEGTALGNLGNAYNSLGRYEEAIDFHQQSLTITREIGDRQGEGVGLVNMGTTQLKLEQYSESLTNNQAALDIFQEIGSREGEAEALKNLAELHHALGAIDLARQYCQQALVLAIELGIPLAAECEALQLKLDQ